MEKDLKIPDEINLLIVKAITEKLSDNDLSVIADWLRADKSNTEYLRSFVNSWILSGAGKSTQEFIPEKSLMKLKERMDKAQKYTSETAGRKFLKWSAVAAAGTLLFILGFLFSGLNNKTSRAEISSPEITEIVCPLGSKTKITLSDGSEIWLNAGSTLKYSGIFGITERAVELEGEAFFSVKSDKDKPFIVNTHGMVVRATGTKFNIKSYNDELTETAILVEGSIEVEIKKKTEDFEKVTLKPNQKLIVLNEVARIIEPGDLTEKKLPVKEVSVPVKTNLESNIKAELYTSWKDDKWIIQKEPLGSFVALLERRYNIKIGFRSEELKNYKFSGTIRNETINQIMEAIRLTAPVKYVIIKDSVILEIDSGLKRRFESIITKR